jgi:hypothetical protein
MGTSQSISPGVSGEPNWGQTSSAISNFANRFEKENENPSLLTNQNYIKKRNSSQRNILKKYFQAAGGRKSISSGRSSKGGKAAVSAANSLGSILSIISRGELINYAESKGIVDFSEKSKSEIISFLLEDICGPTTNFDEAAAKSALDKLLNSIPEDADSDKNIETILQESISTNGIESILIDFFGAYIFEHLFQPIQEHLFDSKGEAICNKTMDEIEEFIKSELNVLHSTRGINEVNWNNEEERNAIVKSIFDNVIAVFENE